MNNTDVVIIILFTMLCLMIIMHIQLENAIKKILTEKGDEVEKTHRDMTIADRIRKMSNEELSIYLTTIEDINAEDFVYKEWLKYLNAEWNNEQEKAIQNLCKNKYQKEREVNK